MEFHGGGSDLGGLVPFAHSTFFERKFVLSDYGSGNLKRKKNDLILRLFCNIHFINTGDIMAHSSQEVVFTNLESLSPTYDTT